MRLQRFSDNTYAWVGGIGILNKNKVLTEKETIAYGTWHLKLNKKEINRAIKALKTFFKLKQDDIAVFNWSVAENNFIFLFTEKSEYSIMKDKGNNTIVPLNKNMNDVGNSINKINNNVLSFPKKEKETK